MKKLLRATCAAVSLVGCSTYDHDHDAHHRGAAPADVDVIRDYDYYYHRDAGDLRSPGGLDITREPDSSRALPPPVTAPSGNRLHSFEPAPRYPTEAVPPQ